VDVEFNNRDKVMKAIMKRSSLFATIALMGFATTINLPAQIINPASLSVSAMEMKDVTGLTAQQKIDKVTQNKGQFGGGDQLRRFFFGDLEPLSVQPGGTGMVVNLYNKATNVTFAYCSTFDVVVAVKSGKVMRFAPEEVK
jgi:hypothetical protein